MDMRSILYTLGTATAYASGIEIHQQILGKVSFVDNIALKQWYEIATFVVLNLLAGAMIQHTARLLWADYFRERGK